MKRKMLGRANGPVTRHRIYRIADGLEIDDIDHYEVSRRRVFFDEVIAITYHKQLGWAVALVFGLPALFLITLAIIFIASGERQAAVICGVMAAFAAVPTILKLFVRVHVVTVFGKRTKAAMKFVFRHGRARSVFEELVSDVRTHQSAIAGTMVSERESGEEFPRPEG